MNVTETPTAQPVGHEGARVNIQRTPAAAINGWIGVVVLAGCVAGMIVSAHHDHAWLWAPILAFVLVATSLVIVTPGQTSVVQFFGRYVGTVRRPGFWLVLPSHGAPSGKRPGPQLRDQPSEGQRRRWQPGRDRRHRGLAGGGHRQVDLRR